MKTAYLTRTETGEHGTFGTFICSDINFSCFTAEPPDKNNIRSLSCIPQGEYYCIPYSSAKYTNVFRVVKDINKNGTIIADVPNRSYVLIHVGNYAGDRTKGFRTDSEGCILLGTVKGYANNQKAVLNSRICVNDFILKMNKEIFKLVIKNKYK